MGAIIVNADDYGWTEGVNRAVDDLAAAGTLSSTSVMVNMPLAGELPGLLDRHPGLGLGVHLTLTEGPPLLPGSRIPALVGDDGHLPSPAALVRGIRRRRIPLRQVAEELRAQVRRARELAGGRLDHWDSHHHIHRFEPLYSVFAHVCAAEGVPAMRAHKHHWLVGGGAPPRPVRPGGGVKSLLTEGYYRLEMLRCRRHFAMPRGILILPDLSALATLDGATLPGTFEVLTHPATSADGLESSSLRGERIEQFDALMADEVVAALAGPDPGCDLRRFADLGS